jgi:hypothetical protein
MFGSWFSKSKSASTFALDTSRGATIESSECAFESASAFACELGDLLELQLLPSDI